ncbi:hypothetical protein Y032_0037g3502 [Ancylostoma ceylanicum]|uniref:Uncharacterized protein n=1 Tax=Ancylostoma ceylanicum TaxID=53326 RepID=A0A016UKM4_9BILA|nr:hypothetical protein Y032_0037g3502 [Ancylostoma ceylanicum]
MSNDIKGLLSHRFSAVGSTTLSNMSLQDGFTDSDDEEILFTKEMVRRLRKSAELKSSTTSRPTSSLSDTSGVSTMSVASGQKKSEEGSSVADEASSSSSPVKETRSSENLLLTPRTRTRVLQEIWGSCETDSAGKAHAKSNPKKHPFRMKLSEFNNTIRILGSKQEGALWKEDYQAAAEIEKCLKKFRAREAPLRELLAERIAAVARHDYADAQRAKNLFERTVDDALVDKEYEKFLSKKEIQRLRKQSPTN